MTIFRPCIDLHNGQVKQIVGNTLTQELKTNFISKESPQYYADLYKKYKLKGGHLIMLGTDHGNIEAAEQVLNIYKEMQVGGGITLENAEDWLLKGATKVIVTSYLFPGAKFSIKRLQELSMKIGKEKLVIDLSCKKLDNEHVVAMNKWQTLTDMVISKGNLIDLSQYCRYAIL
jgi:phosphoribosylformimino-5-aminoimidazole carboxamide ribotide isomerase